MEESKPKDAPVIRERSNFIVNRKFQLKYASLFALLGFISSLSLSVMFYNWWDSDEPRRAPRVVAETVSDSSPSAVSPVANQVWLTDSIDNYGDASRLAVGVYLALAVIAVTLLFFVWGLWVTQRMAGPLHVLSDFLERMRRGDLPRFRPLRENDEFKELYESFFDTVELLRLRFIDEGRILSKSAEELRGSRIRSLERTAGTLGKLSKRRLAGQI